MTKSDLVDALCEAQKMPKGRAELLVNVIFDSMEASLRRGERIEIRGFGSFEIREYRAYEGRNPRTGSAVAVRPKRLPFFKVGKELKERVNDAGQPGANGSNGASKSADKAEPDDGASNAAPSSPRASV
ncbi:MAG: histone family protein DNA-binding protein [Myxococcales bacterium]|jgi:integration host factor subunit beta|nr:histone family protein DNA-binding protein [Myxococcales bacterium]